MSLLHYLEFPWIQALSGLLATIMMIPMVRPRSSDPVYNTGGFIYGVFILVNAGFQFSAARPGIYFLISMVSSVVYIFLSYQICRMYIGRIYRIEGGDESSMVFLMIMYHPLVSLLTWGVSALVNVLL